MDGNMREIILFQILKELNLYSYVQLTQIVNARGYNFVILSHHVTYQNIF